MWTSTLRILGVVDVHTSSSIRLYVFKKNDHSSSERVVVSNVWTVSLKCFQMVFVLLPYTTNCMFLSSYRDAEKNFHNISNRCSYADHSGNDETEDVSGILQRTANILGTILLFSISPFVSIERS